MTTILAAVLLLQTGGHAKFDLVAETATIQPGKPFWVAARFRIDPGWHIYWKNPGDSGVSTSVKLKLPKGFVASEMQWPGPKRFADSEIVNYGYAGEAVFLTQVTPPKTLKTGSQLALAAEASWMACEEMCVMGSASSAVTVTATKAGEAPRADFSRYRARLPRATIALTAEHSTRDGSLVIWWPWQKPAPKAMYFYCETPGLVEVGAAQAPLVSEDKKRLGLKIATISGKVPPKIVVGVLELADSSNKSQYFDVKASCTSAD